MERTKPAFKIPDAINCTTENNFTLIPNDMLRNPKLSAKAKGILCLLLSNKEGWYSHVITISNMMADGETAVRSGLSELEKQKYLLRIKYRDKLTKQYKGMVWCYTDTPENFLLNEVYSLLEKHNLEEIKPTYGKPTYGEATYGKPQANNTNINNTNFKNINKNIFTNSQNNKKDKESFIIYKYWIKKASHISKAQYTQNLEKKIKSKLSKLKWQRNTILQGINNYIKIHVDPKFYYQHSFTLHSFIEQGNGIPRFVEGLDEKYNGDIWQNYCREIKQENKLFTNEIPVQTQIQNYFDNDVLIKAFQNKCLAPAADLFSNISESEITSALLKLHDQIDKKQNKNLSANIRSLLPSPFDLLIGYIDWITKNDWITNLTINMIDSTHSLFLKYCREAAAADNLERDPITGKSYIRT